MRDQCLRTFSVGAALCILSACGSDPVVEERPEITPMINVAPAPAMQFASSPAVEMIIPSLDLVAHFDEGACRVVDGAINPEHMDTACIYTADDRPYTLPGTDADDLVVIAGHTGAGVHAVFNNLYDGSADVHRVHEGELLFIRTEESGEYWLAYQATDLHSPEKTDLADNTAIWGEAATPGRLLTISCIQPANIFAESIKNAVVGWQFIGLSSAADAQAPITPADKLGGEDTVDQPAHEIERLPDSLNTNSGEH